MKRATKLRVWVPAAILAATLLFYFARSALSMINDQYGGIRLGAGFHDAHERAITSFANQKGFGTSRFRNQKFWNDATVIFDGTEFPVRAIHLVGISKTNEPVFYLEGRPPKKSEINRASKRSLTLSERESFQKLLAGAKDSIVTNEGNETVTRIMAPLVARSECAECHQVSPGTLLGAFIYVMAEGYPGSGISLEKRGGSRWY